MDRTTFIQEMERIIHDCAITLQQCHPDDPHFQGACLALGQASQCWLQMAHSMHAVDAHAVLVGLVSTGALHQWFEQGGQGPLPTVMDLYGPPISDEEFGKRKGLA